MKMRLYILALCMFTAYLISSCETGINFSAHMYFYPRDLNFGSVNAGDEKELVLEISNPGVADLRISEMSLIPDINTSEDEIYVSEMTDFNDVRLPLTMTDIKVKKNEYIKVKFVFKPLDAKAKSAVLSINHNASNFVSPLEKTIVGNSSSLTIVPQTLEFGKVNNTKTVEKQVSIRNSSLEKIDIYSLNLSGSPDFKIKSNSGFSTLNPSQVRLVTISFTPSITGLIEANLSINHDSSGSPTIVGITGIGVPDVNRPPSVRQTEVTPGIVRGDGTEMVVFAAEVNDDNGSADIKSVEIDLDPINGLSNQKMYDDGTNGDLVADDNVYSLEYLVPTGLSAKSYEIQITATDYSDETGSGICFLRVFTGNKIYVDDKLGNDVLGDGSDSKPFKTIQKGIDTSNSGDWVVVKSGVYSGLGNVDLNFANLMPTNQTREIILQSESGAEKTVIDCKGSRIAPHRAFRFATKETSSSVVDGFTITNGYTTTPGGGISCNNSSPTIQNCIFSNCLSEYEGGAIYFRNNSKSTIISNEIRDNIALSGAGIFATNSEISILNNSIFNNEASVTGAGISVDGESVIITGNLLKNNNLVSSADDVKGAAIYVRGDGIAPTISGNNIIENYLRSSTGDCFGSGMYVEVSISTFNIDNNNIEGNTIHSNLSEAKGGGLYIAGTNNSAKIFNNSIVRNEAYSNDGIAYGGGLFINEAAKPEIKFNSIAENLCKSQTAYVYGGGVYINRQTSSVFTDNKILSNSAISVSSNCYGGGIYIGKVSSHIDIKNCVIKSNFCSAPRNQRIYGGGLFVDEETVVLVEDCDVSENSVHMASYGYGIAIFINSNTNATIKNTTLNKNQLESTYYCYGGAIYCGTNTVVSIQNCEIMENNSLARYDGYGGAIYFRQGTYSVENCKITNNILNCTRYAYGGAIYCYNRLSIAISSSDISNNKCSGSICRGGAIYTYYSSSNLQINNTLISKNTLDSTDAAYGGGIYAYYSVFNFQNCTIASNNAISDTGDARGGAVYIYNTYITTSINNSILWDNYAISRFGNGSPRGNDFYLENERTYIVIINNCLYSKLAKNGVESIYDPFSLLNPNLACIHDQDPYFVDINADNFRLQHTNIGSLYDSPVIDRGNNTLLPSHITKDLDGNPRYVDGLKNGGTEIDMGCYEKQN